MRGPSCNRYLNCTAVSSETQCIINEITHGATEQNGVATNFAFAAAMDGDMAILRDRSIKRRDFFQGRATIKLFPLDWFAGRVNPGDEKQIVNDSGQPFAFGDGGLDYFAILIGRAITR